MTPCIRKRECVVNRVGVIVLLPDVVIDNSFVKPPSLSINTRSKVLSFFSKILLRFFVLLLLLWLLLLLLPFPEDLLLLWWEGDCR